MTRILTSGRVRAAAVVTTALIPAYLVYAIATADASGRAHTAVTAHVEGPRVSGMVRSPRQACESGRTVLLMKRVGRHDLVVATAITDEEDGAWSTSSVGLDGRYYARLPRTDRCRGAASAPVGVRR